VEGAIKFIRDANEFFKVVIFSTRAETEAGVNAIRKYLKQHGLPEDVANAIKITDKKVKATPYIDDRGWQFQGWFPSMEFIMDFQPWYKYKYEKTDLVDKNGPES